MRFSCFLLDGRRASSCFAFGLDIAVSILVPSFLLFLLLPVSVAGAQGQPLSEQKISDLAGSFGGTLLNSDQFGISSAGIGDLDGDGIEDLAVGAWGDDDGGDRRGAVWILFMNADGTVASEQKISQTTGGFGGTLSDSALFGGRIASLGDLDGDGVGDIAVSAHGDDTDGPNRGALWVLFLNTDGTVKAEQRIGHGSPGFCCIDDEDRFGFGVAMIGDLDQDGNPELAVGAFEDDDGAVDTGSVHILFLLPDGTIHHRRKISTVFGAFGGTLDTGDRFGVDVAALGDLDGDGIPDIAVSADRDDDGGTDRGAVWILFLERDGTVKSEQKLSQTVGGFGGGLIDSGGFGFGLSAVGDINGDSTPDLAVGYYGYPVGGAETGGVFVVYLASTGVSIGSSFHWNPDPGPSAGDRYGASLSGLGDLDGDGRIDLGVGAYLDDDGGTSRGAVWIVNLDGTPLTCGNGVLDPVEECDDGNSVEFDGCSSACETEDDLEIFGIAQNPGLLAVELNQTSVNVSIVAGDDGPTLSPLLVTAVNANPTLTSLGTTAQAQAARVISNGTFNAATAIADGLTVSVNPGTVLSEQKISDSQGGFIGILDDVDYFGHSITNLGDLDGDGTNDLAAGAIGDDDGGTSRGAVWILFLNANGSVKSHQKISDSEGGFGGTLADQNSFGWATAALGDLDGDGVGDLAVGARDDDGGMDRGAIWILLLNADGTVKGHQKISYTQGGFGGTLADDDNFGRSAASLGDLDGDGVTDLAVGAWGDDDGGLANGAVWILFMNANGTVKAEQKISDTQGGFTGAFVGGDHFGIALAPLGDRDGDGIVDLAVGAPDADIGAGAGGRIWILHLNMDGTVKNHTGIDRVEGGFTGVFSSSGFGAALAALGDLDGDGTADLAVSSPNDAEGSVWVLLLNPDGSVKHHEQLSEIQGGFGGTLDSSDAFGSSLVSMGDLDGDGYSDFAVAARGDDDGGINRGAVWILALDSVPPGICGDFAVGPMETCDDGNHVSGDGCFATCEVEDEIEISGTAQGGSIQVILSGISVLIGTSAGQSAATVATNLENAINITPSLQGAGISSVSIGARVVSNGTFDSATSMDAGITVPEPGFSIMLGVGVLGIAISNRLSRRPHP